MAGLKGKVVLVDFWTYTCINCIRTLPHVTTWYDTYKDKGFVVIGVHTPEFAFEKDTNNVLKAIEQFNIHYPVAQDNDYKTWDAFSNRYWPAEYLIDAKGQIRRVHFGEGEYDKMEEAIRLLLKEAGQDVSGEMSLLADQTPDIELSPETYLGFKRMLYLVPGGKAKSGQQTFQMPPEVPLNKFSFGGTWSVMDEYSTALSNATLKYHFTGGKVFLVMKPGSKPGLVKVLVDGKAADTTNAGSDVKDGMLTVDTDRLYTLVDLKDKPGNHTLELQYDDSGIQSFAFTFGS
jgi:thiol-disulfide isomerase/thioredoxin